MFSPVTNTWWPQLSNEQPEEPTSQPGCSKISWRNEALVGWVADSLAGWLSVRELGRPGCSPDFNMHHDVSRPLADLSSSTLNFLIKLQVYCTCILYRPRGTCKDTSRGVSGCEHISQYYYIVFRPATSTRNVNLLINVEKLLIVAKSV